jgi:hypothetical protein
MYTRRTTLGAGLAVGVAWLASAARAQSTTTGIRDIAKPALDPIPPRRKSPTPGKPGDFDFLSGEWRIRNRQPKPKSDGWIEFDGDATVRGILAGVGSVEELRIPVRDFSGMGLRLLDVEKKVWSDHWVNAKSGVMTVPGVTGSFENGAGIFVSDDMEDGASVQWAGIWDLITPRSCRWRQAVSRDGGATWTQTWLMDWRRAE